MAEVVFGGNAASSGPGEGGPTSERRRRQGASQQELLVEQEAPVRHRHVRVNQVRKQSVMLVKQANHNIWSGPGGGDSHGGAGGQVQVDVVALTEHGPREVKLKLIVSTPPHQLMVVWCRQRDPIVYV